MEFAEGVHFPGREFARHGKKRETQGELAGKISPTARD